MDQDPILMELDNGVATITLNRRPAMNSLDLAAKQGLLAALRWAAAEVEVRAVLLVADGRGFCVGQDLREFLAQRDQVDNDTLFRTVAEHYGPISELMATMDKPVVAAVQGAAAGAGMSLALAADFRVASDTATFTTAFSAIALSPDTGMSWYLPRLVGSAKALELLMLSPTLKAAEALALGLVTEVVPAAELADRARALADRLATGPTRSFAAIRRLVLESGRLSLGEALAREHVEVTAVGASADHDGAVRAFVNKEKPTFQGR